MAQSSSPTQVIHLGSFPTSPAACRLASGAHSGQPESFCHAECLNEEPDMGKPFVRFCEGLRHNRCRAEILWHRRETRRQTENTNIMPIVRKASFYSTKTQTPHFRRVYAPTVTCSSPCNPPYYAPYSLPMSGND